jgi:hypothetical protein
MTWLSFVGTSKIKAPPGFRYIPHSLIVSSNFPGSSTKAEHKVINEYCPFSSGSAPKPVADPWKIFALSKSNLLAIIVGISVVGWIVDHVTLSHDHWASEYN